MKRSALLLAGALLIAGCSQALDTTDEAIEYQDSGDGGSDAVTVPPSAEPANLDVKLEVETDRKVIRRATLDLHAADTRAAFDEIVGLVESAGGFVADANVHPTYGEDDQPTVSMTLRVPADELSAIMATIKGSVDEVVAESMGADDVTEQYVDLEARLTNLEALEIELRALLTEVRQQPDADPEALLTVFRELSDIRGQIEQIQGQINYLDDLTALATLDIQLTQTPVAAPIVEDGWQPMEQIKDSLRSLVVSLQDMGDWVINFTLFTLPVAVLTLGIPVGVGFFVYRRFKSRQPSEPTPAES